MMLGGGRPGNSSDVLLEIFISQSFWIVRLFRYYCRFDWRVSVLTQSRDFFISPKNRRIKSPLDRPTDRSSIIVWTARQEVDFKSFTANWAGEKSWRTDAMWKGWMIDIFMLRCSRVRFKSRVLMSFRTYKKTQSSLDICFPLSGWFGCP